ncbi:DUF1501 domain-containing protein [Polaromonas sp. CG_9.11]|uniref:DUF1501 domain-containing protein n=1 Tax=Polaromonas sp. CG_9.11 TaxID=2787730 RepID=UPI0018C92C21|nr:DUF1501 domain-containing protein [Polaromonas sp. CG_9.11]MBG6076426.1 uncharacterized protein (DUF1501 family) [Polaromonas sp. CG_9.11]
MNSPVFSAQALLRRRSLLGLGALSALAVSGVSRRVWAQPAPGDGKTLPGGGRLVVVFLRGACDGLSAFVPYADPDYYAIRPNIAIAAPDGTAQSALRLDSTFALHPALSPLLPLWQQGVLGFVPAAGLPAPNRSHFDAQYQMEIARTGKTSSSPGWLNTVAELNARSGKAGGTSGDGSAVAIGVGEANPVILGGPAAVRLIARGQTAEKTGVLANDKTRQVLLDLYGGNDSLSVAFRQGAGSRMQSAQELTSEKMLEDARRDMSMREAQRLPARSSLDRDGTPANLQMQSAQMLAASNGAADPVGLQLDAQHLGTLMRNDRKLRLGFLSAGGWDTHANQGAATGQLANNLGNLGRGIAQLRQMFSEPGDVIVVMSEFGRTSSENGTRGTDHGFGNALWLIGNSVAGGRWHGEWTGLAHGNLNEGRDLPAHHDYRAVLAQVLRSTFALGDSQLASVLPNSSWDHRLDGLLKKA